MEWVKRLAQRIATFLGLGSKKRLRYNRITIVQSGSNTTLSEDEIVIIKGDTVPKWVKFKCPCGCQFEVMLPLMKSRKPHWTVFEGIDTVSIYPSVDITEGCKSHFWIKKNRVIWCD